MQFGFRYLCGFLVIFLYVILFNITYKNAEAAVQPRTDVQKIVAFCYHDVADNNNFDKKLIYTISKNQLEEHFKMFRENGYTPISIKQYDDYLNSRGTLPPKPVLLSFDDGFESMYKNVFPLLKKYNYPAVFAPIMSYMVTIPPKNAVDKMVTWQQIKEMKDSGLVEIASHSYDLHTWVVANDYGDRKENAATIWWNDNKNAYETEREFNQRIDDDMIMGKKVFERNTGYESNILVWPFGAYNQYGVDCAKSMGYKYQLLLSDDAKLKDDTLLNRYIIFNKLSKKDILKMLNHTYYEGQKDMTAAQLDIDMIYDPMPAKFERNIQTAMDKLYAMRANTVFLQAFADDDGDGNVDEVYFHTDQMKVKADVFSHVAIRLRNEGFWVYAWMPVLSYSFMTQDPDDVITASKKDESGWYKRATPFSPKVHEKAKALVKDLALYAPINGILFQDDLYMNDFEDFSPYAKQVFKQKFNRELTQDLLNENEDIRNQWTRLKTKYLNDLTLELIDIVKYYRPDAKTARNIYPTLITEPESEEWFAQNYDDYLNLYDYVVIMAYPEMENSENDEYVEPDIWLTRLVNAALKNPKAQQKAVFKLQGYDWAENSWIKNSVNDKRARLIKKEHGLNIAQYPVNVFDESDK